MVVDLEVFEESLRDGRFRDAEIQCKGFFLAHGDDNCAVLDRVSVLHCLAQALEAQGKLGEAFYARIRAKEILDNLAVIS